MSIEIALCVTTRRRFSTFNVHRFVSPTGSARGKCSFRRALAWRCSCADSWRTRKTSRPNFWTAPTAFLTVRRDATRSGVHHARRWTTTFSVRRAQRRRDDIFMRWFSCVRSAGKGHVAAGHAVRRQLPRPEQLVQRPVETSGDRANILERRGTNEMFPESHSSHQSKHKRQSNFQNYYPIWNSPSEKWPKTKVYLDFFFLVFRYVP